MKEKKKEKRKRWRGIKDKMNDLKTVTEINKVK
jgi:hypothetical protein